MSIEEIRGRPRRRSRFDADNKVFVPGLPTFVPSAIPFPELEALLLRLRLDEITWKLQANQIDLDMRDRSPSPEPIYDGYGKRLNTKEQRSRDKLNLERHRIVERAKQFNPVFKPPADYKPLNIKKSRKIYIPAKEYPDYNFIGLIIGPRGETQKRMERESGAKIAIRGKGSVKEGKGRPSDDHEELHVMITGDTEESVVKADQMIRQLLVPMEEGKNEHKRAQLRRLAEINGTLRDGMFRFEERPRNWTAPDVFCKYCGEISHPSSDCPQRNAPVNKLVLDAEYEQLMKDIEGGPSASSVDAEKSYEALMADIGGGEENKGPSHSSGYGGGDSRGGPAPWQQEQRSGPGGPPTWQGPPQGGAGAPWQQDQPYGQHGPPHGQPHGQPPNNYPPQGHYGGPPPQGHYGGPPPQQHWY